MSARESIVVGGGHFLLADRPSDPQLIPEDLGEDAHAIGRTIDEFYRRDVLSALPALDQHDYSTARRLLRQAASLGLCAMQTPERFGGLGLELPSVIAAVEHLADSPSYLGWHLGQSSLGTLPIVYYGTDQQRQHYLPRLAAADLIAAYALTEPHSGSDALSAHTRADLSADGREYILSGQKAWITNGGTADLFTVFAKVGGEHFTAFLVERAFGGVTSGAEERKMGLQGTSTTALYLDNVRVPAANVLGEIGHGHVIALNVLNLARLEMGPIALRGAKNVLRESLAYARSRQAQGRPIFERGAIQQKLADMSVRIFAAESATWRATGLVAAAMARRQDERPDVAEPAALAAHAIECAIVKVHASEMLDVVSDEGVQIHGGYGFHRDYHVERAFRDARVNRIFEGTNEINRLAIVSLLLKAAERGHLPLFDAIERVDTNAVDSEGSSLAVRVRLLTLAILGVARKSHGGSLETEQEVSMRLADLIIETFVLQATIDRARTLAARGSQTAVACARIYAYDAVPRIEHAALEIVSRSSAGSSTAATTDWVRRCLAQGPIDAIGWRRVIAAGLVQP